MEISGYPKYGELLKNSVESYPLRDKIVLVMKDKVWVEQAAAMGAVVRGGPYSRRNALPPPAAPDWNRHVFKSAGKKPIPSIGLGEFGL